MYKYLPTHYLEGRVAKGETNNFLRLALVITKHLVTNRSMIDGCKSYKVETLKYHEESHGHQMAIEIYNTAE